MGPNIIEGSLQIVSNVGRASCRGALSQQKGFTSNLPPYARVPNEYEPTAALGFGQEKPLPHGNMSANPPVGREAVQVAQLTSADFALNFDSCLSPRIE